MDRNLLYLFDRPSEPIYVPKGDQKVTFEIPTNYLPEKYQPVAQRILTRFGNESLSSVPIKQIAIPDLSVVLQLSRYDNFSLFIPAHREMSTRLTELFLGMRTVEDLLSLACYCRDRVNSQMFIYALSVAILHRPDTRNLPIPQLCEIFPDKYMDSAVFNKAKEESNIVPDGSRIPIEIPLDYTATNVDPEHRVAYWREDVGVNLHHWHWHLIYPFEGPIPIINKHRRGELFYYFHHQMMARYDVERFCNELPRTTPLLNLREPIREAYFPKLDQTVAGRAWPSRPANMVLSDINRPVDKLKFTISDMERFRDRLYQVVKTRQLRHTDNQTIQLDEVTGIDILGNLMEASKLSLNEAFYGNVHNFGHIALAYIHDPDHRYLESFSVMGDPATAMRDPIFYRWHCYVNLVFKMFKDTFAPYSLQQLIFQGVQVSDIRINSQNGNPNTLNCHWNKSDIDLSRGLDFTPRGAIAARIQHLNHDNFSYTFTVNNSNNRDVLGTVRVFIAPKYDENGRQFDFNNQRLLMIEMDKFTVRLKIGQNTIKRMSTESSITIPFEATFRDLDQTLESKELAKVGQFNYCGCGWPQHMLVPKGTKQGYPMELFVMISNYEQDKVDQPEPTGCRDGVSFCGLRDLKYPDARAMGYPFDRRAKNDVSSLSDFLTPNMRTQQITVRFNDIIKPRQSSNSA